MEPLPLGNRSIMSDARCLSEKQESNSSAGEPSPAPEPQPTCEPPCPALQPYTPGCPAASGLSCAASNASSAGLQLANSPLTDSEVYLSMQQGRVAELAKVTGQLHQLKELGIGPKSNDKLPEDMLCEILHAMVTTLTSVTRLSLYRCDVGRKSARLLVDRFPNVQEFFISITNSAANSAQQGFQHLSHWQCLRSCTVISVGSQRLDLKCIAGLAQLTNLRVTDFEQSTLAAISTLTNLQQLDNEAYYGAKIEPDFPHALAQLKQLQRLHVGSLDQEDVDALTALTALTHLKLRWVTKGTKVPVLPSLRHLRSEDAASIACFLQACPNISVVVVGRPAYGWQFKEIILDVTEWLQAFCVIDAWVRSGVTAEGTPRSLSSDRMYFTDFKDFTDFFDRSETEDDCTSYMQRLWGELKSSAADLDVGPFLAWKHMFFYDSYVNQDLIDFIGEHFLSLEAIEFSKCDFDEGLSWMPLAGLPFGYLAIDDCWGVCKEDLVPLKAAFDLQRPDNEVEISLDGDFVVL